MVAAVNFMVDFIEQLKQYNTWFGGNIMRYRLRPSTTQLAPCRIIPSRDVAEQVRHIHRRHDYVVVGIRDVSNTSIFG